MIKKCVVCGKEHTGFNIHCEDCRNYAWELYKDIPSEWKDALYSLDLSDAAGTICEEYGAKDFRGEIADYVFLIGVGLKSEADLRGFLVKEAKLKPDEAKALAHEIVTLYF